MALFTENEHEIFTSMPTWPGELPEVVVCDPIIASESGTYANPIVIGYDFAPLGSAFNPIVIQVDEGWCGAEPDQLGSDADTEIMATSEFWGSLTGADFALPVKDDGGIDFPVHVPIRSLVHELPEGLQPFEQSTPNVFQPDHKASKVTENLFDALRECPHFGAIRRESVAGDHGGGEQGTEQHKASKTEGPKENRCVPHTFSYMTRSAVPQEISIQTDTSFGKGLSCGSYDIGSTNRTSASTWGSSVLTAIGDELAAIHDHMEHCRNAYCLHAKDFYDGIQFTQKPPPNNLTRSKRLQEQSEGGRVTMRFHVPGFQKGGTWPMEFLVDQVIIRTAFFSPDIPCSLEVLKQDDILFGRGAVIAPMDGEDPQSFLTFSLEVLRDDHGTNIRPSRKRSDGIVIFESVLPEWKKGANWRHDFTGLISIEHYKRWPPLASDYEEREDCFGSIVLSIHSDGVDPKCFLTFSSGLSSADDNPYSAAPDNDVRESSMTTETISLETVDQAGTSVGKNLPRSSHVGSVKRKLSHDGVQSQLRRSERLVRRART